MDSMATSAPRARVTAKDASVSTPAPTYPLYTRMFLIPPLDIVICASLVDCLLLPVDTYSHISDYNMDCPRTYWLHQTQFLSVRRLHHLIIVLSSCTLHVTSISNLLLSRFRLQPMPLTLQPLTSLRRRF
jgi:hypothetical protein